VSGGAKGYGFWSDAEYYEQMSDEAAHHLVLDFGAVTTKQIKQVFARIETAF
jgi:hypothetical protein